MRYNQASDINYPTYTNQTYKGILRECMKH